MKNFPRTNIPNFRRLIERHRNKLVSSAKANRKNRLRMPNQCLLIVTIIRALIRMRIKDMNGIATANHRQKMTIRTARNLAHCLCVAVRESLKRLEHVLRCDRLTAAPKRHSQNCAE